MTAKRAREVRAMKVKGHAIVNGKRFAATHKGGSVYEVQIGRLPANSGTLRVGVCLAAAGRLKVRLLHAA